MKKISQTQTPTISNFELNDSINPQQNQTRCKICFEEKMPLVTLCQCTGSIAYVHEDCILDWIALKMEKSQLIQIPKCEICKSKFSATMKIGSKKIDNTLLLQKIKKIQKKQWLIFGLSVVGFTVALLIMLVAIFNLFTGKLLQFTSIGSLVFTFIKTAFYDFVFPSIFLDSCIRYYKKKWKLIQDCKVQLVEVTLLPRKILKV